MTKLLAFAKTNMAAHPKADRHIKFVWGQPPSAVHAERGSASFLLADYCPAITVIGAALAITGPAPSMVAPSMRMT